MNASRPLLSRGVFAAVAALLVMAVAASTASAATGHALARSIGLTGTGTLGGVGGVVARSAQNDVLVLDPSTATVQQYTQAGENTGSIAVGNEVASPSYLAYDPSSQDVYVSGTDALGAPVLARYDVATGTPVPTVDLAQAGVTGVSDIAVDSQGRLYIGDTGTTEVRVFTAAGNADRSFDGSVGGGTKFESLGALAVDGANNIYVVEPYSRAQKFSARGLTYGGRVGSDLPLDLTIDPSNNDVYLLDSPDGARFGITRYTSAGVRQARFAEQEDAVSFAGLSVGNTNHTLFVGNPSRPAVDVYTTFVAPDVTTNTPPTTIDTESAGVTGVLNPRGTTTYTFDYGVDTNYASATPQTTVSGSANQGVAGELTGLRPNTLYHYRLRAFTGQRSNLGVDRTFTTVAAPPTVSGESATATTPTSATLNATVNPNNNSSSAYFEYRPEGGAVTQTAPVDTGGGSNDSTLTANLTSLQPDTVYVYRVVAQNGVGNGTRGQEFTFRTARALPLASGAQATVTGANSAQFSGVVDTRGLQGEATFLVQATNSTYFTNTAAIALPEGQGSRPVSTTLDGLPAGGTFQVRLRIRTTTGTVLSDPASFSTAYVAAPALPAPSTFNPFPYAPVVTPSNRFTASASVKASTGTIKVKVPGRGVVTASGSRLTKGTSRPTKAGTVSLRVKLTKSGRAALRRAKSKRLRIKVAVRYRPTDGTTRTGYRTLTFKR